MTGLFTKTGTVTMNNTIKNYAKNSGYLLKDEWQNIIGNLNVIKAPTHWASYLVNGDLSGFSEQEKADVLAFEKKYGRCDGMPENVGLACCEHTKGIAECSIYYMIKEG